MILMQPDALLSLKDNILIDSTGTIIATVPENLGSERMCAYAHLFVTAPELLNFLETEVAPAIEIATAPRQHSYTGRYIRFEDKFPKWIDDAMQGISLAFGEETTFVPDDLELTIAGPEDNALEDDDGKMVIHLPEHLSKAQADDYINLFLAAPVLLRIVEGIAKEELAAIGLTYDAGMEFDPAAAGEPRFIIPNRLRFICDLIAKAKGAVPLSRSSE